jgi:hypothetical protein
VELVGGCGAGGDVVLSHSYERLEVSRDWVQWSKPAQSVTIGTEIVGQHVAVCWVRFGSPCSPAQAGGVKRIRVHRDDGMARGEETFHHDPVWPLDRHWQIGGRGE